MTLGDHPEISLDVARSMAEDIHQRVARGEDPATTEKEYELDALFPQVVRRYFERRPEMKGATRREYERILKRELYPAFERRLLPDITRQEVRHLLFDIAEKRERPAMANRTRALLHALFDFALERGLCAENIVSEISRFEDEVVERDAKPRRILSREEISRFWHACEEIGDPVGAVFQFLLLTGQSAGLVLKLHWGDISFERWEILKDGRDPKRLVFLAPLAVQILRRLNETRASSLVFSRKGATTFIRRAPQQLSEMMGPQTPPWSARDLRATVEISMLRLGIRPEIVARALGLTVSLPKRMRGNYSSSELESELRAAFLKWGHEVASIVSAPTTSPSGDSEKERKGKIVQFPGPRRT